MLRRTLLALGLSSVIACGGGDTPTPAPTAPTPPVPVANQSPEIVSATVSPAFGVWGVTTFTAHVEARDPDGDPLSIAWTSPAPGGVRTFGTTVDLSFKAGDIPGLLKVTITDRNGATASREAPFRTVGLSEHFDGYFGDSGGFDFRVSLKQTGTTVTGTYLDTHSRDHRTAAIVDGQPGEVDAEGRFRIAFKGFADFTMVGQLEVSQAYGGFSATGTVIGGPFSGRRFTFSPHDSF